MQVIVSTFAIFTINKVLCSQMSDTLQPGTLAPNFTLESNPEEFVSLTDYQGQPVVLIFYPADWSPVCGDQIALYNEMITLFNKYNAQLFGISVDSKWCHQAYSSSKKLEFPLLSDFEPKGEVSKLYGSYRDNDGTSERSLFVIDESGIITWSYISPIDDNPGADGILQALKQQKNK